MWTLPVWLILFLIGQGWSRICAYTVAGFGFACLALAAISMHLMYKALGERFGFKVSWRNAPPYRYKAFGVWCRANGVDPATGRPLDGRVFHERAAHAAGGHASHNNVVHSNPKHSGPGRADLKRRNLKSSNPVRGTPAHVARSKSNS